MPPAMRVSGLLQWGCGVPGGGPCPAHPFPLPWASCIHAPLQGRAGTELEEALFCGGSGVPGGGGLREDTSSPGTAETLVNVGELRLRFEISPMKLVYYPKSIFLYSVWGH